MVALVPGWSIMKRKLVRMGYVEFEFNQDTILGLKGMRLRGHEFHWSEMASEPNPSAYRILHPQLGNEGYSQANVLASYVHLHVGTDPSLARNFIAACQRWAASSQAP